MSNSFPENIYVGSFDPLHLSHVNTKKKAEEILQSPVSFVICQNDLKNGQSLTITERKKIIQEFFPLEPVFEAYNKDQILKFLKNAKHIVRGIRSELDEMEIKNIAHHYGDALPEEVRQQLWKKLIEVPVPEELKHISSSKIKKLIAEGNDLLAMKQSSPLAVSLLKEKIE